MKRNILSFSFIFLLAAFTASAADLPTTTPAADPAAVTQTAAHAKRGKKPRKKHHRTHRHKGTAPAPAQPKT
jgi:Skp family chaperone for outer membrane proteins